MNVKEAIEKRRAYRSLESAGITKDIIKALAQSASFSPSCFNYQPWRFVFVYEEKKLKEMYSALSKGNEWAKNASMIVAVFSKKDFDCVVKEREYYLFDTGMAVALMLLRAMELGLVAHPIAGYDENKTKEILNIPGEMRIITLIIVGKHSDEINALLSEKQAEVESERPARKDLHEFVWFNSYTQ